MESAMESVVNDYGRRLLPIVVETAAQKNPDRIAYSFPITNNPSKGFHEITNQVYANGVNRLAWWIEENFGKPRDGVFPTIGYIGPNDLRYPMLTIAAVKLGYKMMLLSPRNSVDGHLAVIEKCGCDLWILPSTRTGHVDEVLERRSMKIVHLPELLYFLNNVAIQSYVYSKTFDEARQDPFVVLHTSGSTGLPKPVIITNGCLATPDAHHLLPAIEGRLTQAQYFTTPHRAYSTFPNFHSAGMVWTFAIPFFYELTVVLGPPMAPVNLDLVNSMFDYGNIDGSFLAPSTLEDISRSSSTMNRMAKTLFTVFGGGPLSQKCGDTINAVTRVFNTVGVTEGSLFPIVQAEREDWNYIHFHPAGGYTFRQKSNELFEQFQIKDPKLELFQAFFQTFPDEEDYAIKDLYSKHPTKEGRWLYKGRADDIIVLSNGEKLNPLDMESAINNHPAIKASLIVGQGKFQTAALIELRNPIPASEEEFHALNSSIWHVITSANAQAPAHAQVHEDHIIFSKPEKPFVLAGKETVLRAMTVKLYETEINSFYTDFETQRDSDATPFDMSSLASTVLGVHSLICKTLGINQLGYNVDFFAAGLDSLSVLKVLAGIRATLRNVFNNHLEPTVSMVYSNPTIERLSVVIFENPEMNFMDEIQQMQTLSTKYSSSVPPRSSPSPPQNLQAGISVLLTGSTGSLGSYLLEDLLSREQITRIVCLNRSLDAETKQRKSNQTRGLCTDWDPQRVEFLHSNLSEPDLGLENHIYKRLLTETTHIIHNQWQVDFNLTLSFFEPHIRGVRNLIDFSLESHNSASIFFISSVGVVNNRQTDSTVPEVPLKDFSLAKGGYGQSKLVAESILLAAGEKSGVRSSICRVGQIAGPVNTLRGMWNKHEWLPSIIASSNYLGMLPSTLASLNRVDWLPVNMLSHVILEFANLDSKLGSTLSEPPIRYQESSVYHAVNPNATLWSSLVPVTASFLGSAVKVVPWEAWFTALRASEGSRSLEDNPALKLFDFFKAADERAKAALELPVLRTERSALKSPTLQSIGPIREEWMIEWMEQWNFKVVLESSP